MGGDASVTMQKRGYQDTLPSSQQESTGVLVNIKIQALATRGLQHANPHLPSQLQAVLQAVLQSLLFASLRPCVLGLLRLGAFLPGSRPNARLPSDRRH